MGDPAAVAATYFAAVTAHDADAVAACFAADAELVTAAGTYRGPSAIADFYRQTAFQFADLRPVPGPLLVDGGRVAVEIELRMGGQTSHVADFFTVEADQIRRLVIYLVPGDS